MEDYFLLGFWGIIFVIVIIKFFQSIRLVPTKTALIVERFGKYSRTLDAGFHPLLPFVEKVAYTQDLKERTFDIPPQDCFTKDNVKVEVDGVMYISVEDPHQASYGVTNYFEAASELAQTTLRSVVGTLELDRMFKERTAISSRVVSVLTEAGLTWGIRVHRYEIKNIETPSSVRESMEKLVSSERQRRALVAESEGTKQSQINRSEGIKMEMVNQSEGEKQKRINEAEGKAQEILAIAKATADSISKVGSAIHEHQKGGNAVRLELAQRYLTQIAKIGRKDTNVLIPADLTKVDDLINSLGLK
ncbi:MAG: regulator of protease activity HflC (stomatin/prohibitin superfamily) [bacterium]|jgi:regulator of protease activity HflC (stomatin/prohibitin superfamily)